MSSRLSAVHFNFQPSGQPYYVIDSQVSPAVSLQIAPMNIDVTHLRNSCHALCLIQKTWSLNQPKGSGGTWT